MTKYAYHADHTEPTNPQAVFVFGSNLAARHGGGAAKLAADKYGAVASVAEGPAGLSYAIPTKDARIETLPLEAIKAAVERFIDFAKGKPDTEFFMTRIGCVLAGYENKDIAPMFAGAPTNINFPEEWKEFIEPESGKCLILRTCAADMSSKNGFVWPDVGGTAVAHDWMATKECGNGLHGWLYGQGDHDVSSYLDETAKWLVVETDLAGVVMLGGKCKFESGVVRFVGNKKDATDYLIANEPRCANVAVIGASKEVPDGGYGLVGALGTLTGGYSSTLTGGYSSTLTGGDGSTLTGGNRSTLTGGDGSTLTGGNRSTLTGGDYSTLTGGDYSTLTGGDYSTLTGGDGSTLTGGNRSTLTGGDGSTLIIKYWDGDRYRAVLAEVGVDGIKAGVAYRLNDSHKFEEVTP